MSSPKVAIRVSPRGDYDRIRIVPWLYEYGYKAEEIKWINQFQFMLEDPITIIAPLIAELARDFSGIDILGLDDDLTEELREEARVYKAASGSYMNLV